MIAWSPRFDCGIESVDEQHRGLWKILFDVYDEQALGIIQRSDLERYFDRFVDYAHFHFEEEEHLMTEGRISDAHLRLHRMEHNAFIDDLQRIRALFAQEIGPAIIAERMVSFAAGWLVLHILGIDMSMKRQLDAIAGGMDPENAHDTFSDYSYDRRTTRDVVSCLLTMWREAEERADQAEARLATLIDDENDA